MTGAAIHQRCWNHEAREAVCRCPECGRSFCRECVTEHEARLLCAACLKRQAQTVRASPGSLQRVLPAVMLVAGIAFAWVMFFGAGQALNLLTVRLEQSAWQNR